MRSVRKPLQQFPGGTLKQSIKAQCGLKVFFFQAKDRKVKKDKAKRDAMALDDVPAPVSPGFPLSVRFGPCKFQGK